MLAARKVQSTFLYPLVAPDFTHREQYTNIQINAQKNMQDLLKDTFDKVEGKTLNMPETKYKEFKEEYEKSKQKMAFLKAQRDKALSSVVIEKKNIYKDSPK